MPQVFRFSRVDAEYTPAEAADVTGVSTALQRDWRRRGILGVIAPGKHSRFKFNHLCEMFALKSFADAGLGVSEMSSVEARRDRMFKGNYDAESAAHFCLFPMLYFADQLLVETGKNAIMTVRTSDPDHKIGRYVFVNRKKMFRTENLANLELAIEEDPDCGPAITLFDCKTAAEQILSRLPRRPYELVVRDCGQGA
jgi:hypothetical protein